MDTIKINKGNVKMIAHRGVSGLECENTAAAFVAAGNRSYFGIETDMHITSDGKFVILHDASLARVSGVDKNVEQLPFYEVEDIRLYDREEGVTRRDLVIPTLEEYIRICKRYDKVAVLELKGASNKALYADMISMISSYDYIEHTVFISFGKENVLTVRRLCPNAVIQFLTSKWEDSLLDWLIENRLDLDINHTAVTRELVELIHSKGMEINCWTVNEKERGEELVSFGVDYITTNILE